MNNEKIGVSEIDTLDPTEVQQDENRILTFRLEKQFYGISIAYVEQIVSMQPLTEVPEFPPYAKGIMSLRGEVIPIVDLRMCLGMKQAAYTERTCILIANIGELHLGCIVDEVDAVVIVTQEQLAPAPRMAEGSTKDNCTSGIAKLPGESGREKVIVCLDAAKLLRADELSALQKASQK